MRVKQPEPFDPNREYKPGERCVYRGMVLIAEIWMAADARLANNNPAIFTQRCVRCFNPQYTERISDRVRQAQKGNSKQWSTNKKPNVSFATEYPPRDWHTFDADRKLQGNVITIPSVVSNSKEKVNHPTQKPIRLMEYLIRAYTNEGDCVLDCTMGSGSTMVACANTGRRGIGIELDDKYYDIAMRRVLEAHELKLPIF